MAKNKKTVQDNLDVAMKMLEKQYGKGVIFKMNSAPLQADVIPTGSMLLDKALGVGGIPRGRITEIYGPESAGKTSLALHIIAEAQKQGGKALFIDAEHAMDLKYAKNIGVNVDELLISQPDSGEQALEILETMVRSGEISVIVVDSVAALTPQAEIDGDMGSSHMGLHARLMSQAMRKLTAIISKSKTAVIFTNQIRMKIGIMFGNPETTTGGNALKFYASIRLEIRRMKKIEDKFGEFIGNEVKIKVVKNKLSAPFKEINTAILFGKGIFKAAELLNIYIEKGEIQKNGSWFKYKDQTIQGMENMLKYVEENLSELPQDQQS